MKQVIQKFHSLHTGTGLDEQFDEYSKKKGYLKRGDLEDMFHDTNPSLTKLELAHVYEYFQERNAEGSQ